MPKTLMEMTLPELMDISARVRGLIQEKLAEEQTRLNAIREEIGLRRTNAGKSATPKYQNPSPPFQKWSGRGRTPNWMLHYLDAGQSKKDFLINPMEDV